MAESKNGIGRVREILTLVFVLVGVLLILVSMGTNVGDAIEALAEPTAMPAVHRPHGHW